MYALLLAALLAGAGRAPDEQTFRIGELELSAPSGLWELSGSGDRYLIDCTANACEDVSATVEVTAAARCTPEAVVADMADAYNPRRPAEQVRTAGGLGLWVAYGDPGCRNWSGAMVSACTVHGGRAYHIRSLDGHCERQPRADQALMGFLQTLRPARP